MYILGINAVFHDSAACILKDGKLIAAAEEERFTHVKHGKRPVPFSTYELPFHAIDYCLREAGIHLNEVEHIAYSFRPELLLTEKQRKQNAMSLPLLHRGVVHNTTEWLSPWDPLFVSYILNAPEQLEDGWPHHLQKRFCGAKDLASRWHYVEHHVAHAASAFHASPYERAAVMTIDGRGERATTAYYHGIGQELRSLGEVAMPHSLGLLYEQITTHLGFLHSSDEYKVMALASYGKPTFVEEFRSLIEVGRDGQYTVSTANLSALFGAARLKDDPFTEHHFNIAHSLQKVLQEKVLLLAEWLHGETHEQHLCMAGGVALNCVLNSYLRDYGPFKQCWVQPAAGDAGTALGAALWIDTQVRKESSRSFAMDHAYWGPAYTDDDIQKFLDWTKTPYTRMENVAEETAAILAQDKIVGWFQGRMEFGPRALGSRSILASPINPSMQARLNEVKDREDFRPVAPVVMEDHAAEWFENAQPSPFMLFLYPVKEDKKDRIPAVTHVDNTARIQTVNERQHPDYYALLQAFYNQTGVPVLVNTSFNTLGKPVVCTPRDAIECFWSSPFDALVIGSFLVEKPAAGERYTLTSEYLSSFSSTR